MDMEDPRVLEVFFEVFYDMPRFGPGSEGSLKKALTMVPSLQEQPVIADLGAGNGVATLRLADFFPQARIIAVDNHAPFMETFNEKVKQLGLQDRIQGIAGDMKEPPVAKNSLDMIMSEGAIYNIGFETGFQVWFKWLKPKGIVVVSEAVWIKENPPEAVKQMWEKEYPAITSIDDNLRMIEQAGYSCLKHFTLPVSDWWDEYYVPMQKQLDVLTKKYGQDPLALEVLATLQEEINTYKNYSEYYSYEFFICQKL